MTAFLKQSFTANRRVLIKGKPGIGKSDIVAQACADIGAVLVLMHPAISDPTDYKGMPALTAGGTEAHFLPFGDLNKLIKAKAKTVCFLDDIGQAAPAVQAALMQLILARSVNGSRISDEVVFVGATNDTTHAAGVSGMIEPLKSRWDTIIELECSVDDWTQWAFANNMPVDLIAYLRSNPQSLSDFKPTKELRNSPCPRTWAAVGKWINANVEDYEVLAGAVGESESVKYLAWRTMQNHLPSLDDILLNPSTAPIPPQTVEVVDCKGERRTYSGACIGVSVATALARKATPQNFGRILVYTDRLEKRLEILTVKDAIRQNKAVCMTPAFVEWSVSNQGLL